MYIKKAAMFGLDARIALAIFGALSIITGASLYSAIKETEAVRLVTQIKELQKAYESYILDTGTHIRKIGDVVPTHSNKAYGLNLRDLTFDSGVTGWKGPYYTASFEDKNGDPVDNVGYDGVGLNMSMMSDAVWPADSAPACISTTGNACKAWISIWSNKPGLLESITQKLDNDKDDSRGVVRTTTAHTNFIFVNTGLVYPF